MNRWAPLWHDFKQQWSSSARLRLALWAVLAILWAYGLLVLSDAMPGWRGVNGNLKADIDQARAIGADSLWAQRAKEAERLLAAADALSWEASRPGLAQAEIQDWLRTTATKTGLLVREVRLASADAAASAASTPSAVGDLVRVRLSAEFTPLALVAFLNELERAERGLMVERLQLKTWTRPAQVDLDIKVRLRGRREGAAA